jgi:hypothetical protein
MDFLSAPVFNNNYIGYSDVEIQKVKRIYDWMVSKKNPSKIFLQRYNFAKFITEHDRRRGTDFGKVFPELKEFYEFTKTIQL